jgi:hypothetical protein
MLGSLVASVVNLLRALLIELLFLFSARAESTNTYSQLWNERAGNAQNSYHDDLEVEYGTDESYRDGTELSPGDFETWESYMHEVEEEMAASPEWDESMYALRKMMDQTANITKKDFWRRNATITVSEEGSKQKVDFIMVYCIGFICFAGIVILRIMYKRIRISQYNEWLERVNPKPYFPTTGSVWSLKRYQHSLPPEIEVTAQPSTAELSKLE